MKLLASILSVALIASLTGCKKTVGPMETTPTKDTQSEEASKDSELEATRKKEEAEQREKLLEAIQVYRNSAAKLAAGESPAYQLAWNTIKEAKQKGIQELKKELEKVANIEEGDGPFETAASLLLFEIGGLDEAEAVAEIWNRIPHKVNYNGMFFAALKAAKSRDQRAIPMLKACLTSQDGTIFVFQSGIKVFWPQTHEVLWGVYGPQGLPVLLETLKNTKNTVVQKSAVRILAAAGYIDALEEVRRLSQYGIGSVKLEAIRALGLYGHPEDYDRLIAGLSSTLPDEVVNNTYALLNYQDLRATESILPLTDSDDVRIKKAALSTISYLLTPQAIQTLRKCSKKETDNSVKTMCTGYLDMALQKMGVSWNKFASKSKDEKKKLVASVHQLAQESYTSRPDDQKLTRDQFDQTIKEWQQNQTIQVSTLDWVRSRHIIQVAKPEDIEKLLLVKAALLLKLSKQSFAEVGLIDEMVKHLSRSRYRKPTGISESVE